MKFAKKQKKQGHKLLTIECLILSFSSIAKIWHIWPFPLGQAEKKIIKTPVNFDSIRFISLQFTPFYIDFEHLTDQVNSINLV